MSKAIAHPRDELVDFELSPAREAAEAAFAHRPPATREAPLVVVKRRRLIGDAMERDSGAGHAALGGDAKEARVFRVDSGLFAEGQPQAKSQSPKEPPGESTMPSATRSRRRTPHGKVTIIRPEPPDATPGSTPQAPAASSGSSGRRARDPHPPILDAETVARYEAVMAEIEVLKRRAVELKKAEAGRAVRWIRQAMSEYGITARDLGL